MQHWGDLWCIGFDGSLMMYNNFLLFIDIFLLFFNFKNSRKEQLRTNLNAKKETIPWKLVTPPAQIRT